ETHETTTMQRATGEQTFCGRPSKRLPTRLPTESPRKRALFNGRRPQGWRRRADSVRFTGSRDHPSTARPSRAEPTALRPPRRRDRRRLRPLVEIPHHVEAEDVRNDSAETGPLEDGTSVPRATVERLATPPSCASP